MVAIVKRQIPNHVQDARRRELYELNARRMLTDAEAAELDNLEQRLYHRVWRAQQREAEQHLARLAARQALPGPRRHVA